MFSDPSLTGHWKQLLLLTLSHVMSVATMAAFKNSSSDYESIQDSFYYKTLTVPANAGFSTQPH